jgi:ubiquinone/menaquinone biosynthesis C-methylase UbiE
VDRAAYDEIADWYDEALRTGPLGRFQDFAISIVLDLAGEIEDLRLCDLACAQGILSRHLARLGAVVTGVDVSEKMLDLARRYQQGEPRRINYVRSDARSLPEVPDEAFEGLVCNLALMDIPDLEATLHTVARVLRPGGWFIFSITHPCFPTPSLGWTSRVDGDLEPEIPNYFAEGFWRRANPEGVRGKVGSHHRTMSTYLNALALSGLRIDHLVEPHATGVLVQQIPGYCEVPPFLVARCKRDVVPD